MKCGQSWRNKQEIQCSQRGEGCSRCGEGHCKATEHILEGKQHISWYHTFVRSNCQCKACNYNKQNHWICWTKRVSDKACSMPFHQSKSTLWKVWWNKLSKIHSFRGQPSLNRPRGIYAVFFYLLLQNTRWCQCRHIAKPRENNAADTERTTLNRGQASGWTESILQEILFPCTVEDRFWWALVLPC